MIDDDFDIGHMTDISMQKDSIQHNIQKLNRFNIRVGHIHIGSRSDSLAEV
jgi:hypothetical protein